MFESKINRGKANGYAPLDGSGKVPLDKTYVGANGTSGTSGISGTSGVNGSQGSNGVSGTSGIDGTNGTDGVDGTSGVSGEAGSSGTSGFSIDSGSFATTGSNTFIGNQTINGSLTIVTPSEGVPNSVSDWNGQGGWNQAFYSNLATTGGTGTGLTVNVTAEGSGYIDINAITINTPGSGYTNGDVITIDNENNLPGTFTIGIEEGSGWIFDSSGSLTTPGDINVSGSIYADNLVGLISSSAQITQFGGLTKNSGSWTVEPGTGNYSFTLDSNNTYQIWVLGNIPNGIITYNGMVTISNTNVPVIGSHNAWNYTAGNELLFTSIPNQIVTTSGSISSVVPDGIGTNTNTFTFGITNNADESVVVNYGYVKIS